MRRRSVLWALVATGIPSLAAAHPGHGVEAGFLAGFLHPFSGIDHVLAMLCVAWWAQLLPHGLRWRVPLGFLAGLFLGTQLPMLPGAEALVAGSLVGLGLLLLPVHRRPTMSWTAPWLALGLAMPHGMAHASELAGGAWLPGVLCASALLHMGGAIAGRIGRSARWPQWLAATPMVLAGTLWLAPT